MRVLYPADHKPHSLSMRKPTSSNNRCDPACCLPAQSTAALPVGTIVVILLIWSVITIPLTVFGGIAGKNHQVCQLIQMPVA